MNYVEIDFTKSCPTINTTYAGEKGEIDAVNLKVIPEEEMMSNTSVTSFFLLFATAEGTESSRSYSKAEAPFICALWEDVTNQNVVEFQLLGQNSAGSVVMKSPIVQLYIGESVDDSTIVTPGTSRDTLLNRIAQMEEEIDEFEERWEDATATTTTLSENESATVSIVAEDTVTFNFGIPKGKTGTSISSIVKTSTVGLVDTYTITFSNGTTTTFTVTNGAQGQKGDKGDTGAKGDKGDKGDEGEKGDTGEKGDKGDTGAKGDKGDTGDTGATGNGIASTVLNADYTLTITFTNGTTYTTPSIRGAMGDTGNGISSVAKTGTSGLIDTYTITYTDGTTSTFTVTNGKGINNIAKTSTSGLVDTYTITFNDGTTSTYNVTNGEQGATGNGISSVAKTSTSGLVDTYTITFTDGTTTTFNITNGEDGTITSVNGKSEAHVVLDADDIAYDNTDSVKDKLLAQSQEIENKADKDAYVETLEVGLADNLIDRKDIGSSEEIAYRTTHDKISVTEDGNADVQVVKGNTICWNQRSNVQSWTSSTGNLTFDGGTITYVSKGISAYNQDIRFSFSSAFSSAFGHDILIIANVKSDTQSNVFKIQPYGLNCTSRDIVSQENPAINQEYNIHRIVNTTSIIDDYSSTFRIVVCDYPNALPAGAVVTIKNIKLVDLTRLNDSSVTDYASFIAKYSKPEYPNNAGQLINFNGTSLVSNGFNQLDTEGHIRVIGGKTYRIEGAYTSIKDSSNNDVTVTNNEFTPSVADTYTVVATTMPCIHFKWSGYRDGDTESYWQNAKSLDFVQTYFPNGMKSAGSAYDEINFKTHKAITRIGSVDLGSLNWNRYAETKAFQTDSLVDAKINSYAISSKFNYETLAWVSTKDDVCSFHPTISRFYVKPGSTYTDANAFKIAMRGVMLYYELATPTEVDIPTSLTCIYPCADFGTERLTPSTYDLLTSPMKATIHYNLDYTRQIENNILESGTNIKTINNQSLLGSGNINIGGGSASSVTYDNTTSGLEATNVQDAIDEQSEKIANKVIIDTTQEIKVGTYTDSNGTKDIYQSTIVVNNLSFGSHIHDSIDISSLSIDRILSYNVVADNSDHTYSQPMGNGGGQSLSAERFNVGRYNATYLYYYLGNEYSSLFTSMLITIQYIKL